MKKEEVVVCNRCGKHTSIGSIHTCSPQYRVSETEMQQVAMEESLNRQNLEMDRLIGEKYKSLCSASSSASERQVGGIHYQKSIQPWDAMEAWMSKEQFEGYLRGNVIKYVSRYTDKNGTEDLEKAKHYLDKLIEFLKGAEGK